MTIRQAAAGAIIRLKAAGIPDPEQDAALLLSHLTGFSPMEARLHAADSLTAQQEQRLSSLLLSREQREPLQYLLREQWFYGLRFFVDSSVLIPRQETEALCELGLGFLRSRPCAAALDLCTGSGAIAVTLKHECPAAAVTAADVSGAALEVARRNAHEHGADVRFVQGDLFAPIQGERFDLILSNPPYIESADLPALQPEVRREPPLALNGGADGLDFYRRIAAEGYLYLTPGGMLAVEVGDGQWDRVAGLFGANPHYAHVRVHCDLYGMKRMVSANAAATPT